MRKFVYLGILIGSLAVPAWGQAVSGPGQAAGYVRKFIGEEKVKPGMSREEVLSLLGDKVVTGYELTDPKGDQYRALSATNPWRTETVSRGRRTYVVDYYLAGIRTPDDKVTDDELLPLVFLNDRLVGTGWDFLTRKIKR